MLIPWPTRVLLLLLAGGCFSVAQGQDNPLGGTRYRSAVSEVRVAFFATDESNHALQTVTTSDFAIVDNERVVRNFRSLTRSDETSLQLVVMVDLSESVAPNFPIAMNNVLQLIAREQSIADDNIAVVSFGGTFGESSELTTESIQPRVLCSSGCLGTDAAAKLQAAKSGGLTPLFDALIFAANLISQHGPATGPSEVRGNVRPVVILFSDGNDSISLHTANEARQALLEAGAMIYSADVGPPGRRTSGSVFLQQISTTTGGRYFSPRVILNDDATSLLSAVLEDLRGSYVVTYDLPSHQPGFHTLRLLPTHNLNLTFHSRVGYNYDPARSDLRSP